VAAASLACGAARAAEAPPAAAEGWHAGEMQRATKTASAGLRNHGDETLRLVVWYPAPASARETPAVIGDPAHPVFVAGRVAPNAPWANAAHHPLMLLSHGFGGVGRQLTWLGSALARHGYVAVAVDHPGTNGRDGVTPEGAYTPWERAGDIGAALDLVLADPAIRPHVDAGRIGFAGFSLGGWTGALLAGARTDFTHLDTFCASAQRDSICDPQIEFPLDFSQRAHTLEQPALRPLVAREKNDFRDPRIRAAFLIAPALGEAIDAASLARVEIPVAVVAGSADPVAVPATNAEIFAHGIPRAQLVILPRVRHYDFLSECGPEGRRTAADYCADGAGTQRAETHAATINVAIEFFDAALGTRAAGGAGNPR
jgi:predicted dienelactone hydrolase